MSEAKDLEDFGENLIFAPEGGYCARASNFSVRPSVLSVCLSCPVLSVAQDELEISKFRVRQKSSFKPETDRESLIFTQKIQVIGRSEIFCNVTESNYKISDVKDVV